AAVGNIVSTPLASGGSDVSSAAHEGAVRGSVTSAFGKYTDSRHRRARVGVATGSILSGRRESTPSKRTFGYRWRVPGLGARAAKDAVLAPGKSRSSKTESHATASTAPKAPIRASAARRDRAAKRAQPSADPTRIRGQRNLEPASHGAAAELALRMGRKRPG